MQITLKELAGLLGGELGGPPNHAVSGIKGLEEAGPTDLAFLANPKYAKLLPKCQAGVVLVSRRQEVPEGLPIIRVDDPYLAFARAFTYATAKPYRAEGVHPGAVVHESAQLGAEVTIKANAVVEAGARLGDRVVLHPGVVVGEGAEIGDDTLVYANVTIYHGCRIGKRCIIHGGCVIGGDGYGFAKDGDRWFKIPQVGIVQVDDDVELGAGNTIDRAVFGKTWIKSGVKTDDQVHVAHNCVVGENTLLVAQVGVAGSTTIGKNVVIGGQAGIVGHATIGDGAMIGAMCGVSSSIKPGEVVNGYPHMPHTLWLRTSRLIQKLPELFKRVRDLEKMNGQ